MMRSPGSAVANPVSGGFMRKLILNKDRGREMMGKIRTRFTILAAIGVLATACGSSTKAASSAPPPSPSVQVTVSASPSPQGIASPTSTSPDCGELAGLTGVVNDKGTQEAAGKTAEVQIVIGFAFAPTCTEAKAGETLALTVSNTDAETHTFTITDQSIDETISPGKSILVHIKVPTSGAVPFYCRYHSTFGQQGAIVAEP
jgi:plastocyanin